MGHTTASVTPRRSCFLCFVLVCVCFPFVGRIKEQRVGMRGWGDERDLGVHFRFHEESIKSLKEFSTD